MALVDFRDELMAADSVLDLARRLGDRCMASAAELKVARARPEASRELRILEKLVGQAPLEAWEDAVRAPATCEEQLGADLIAAVKNAKPQQPIDFLGVLRGLCSGPLVEHFESTSAQVELIKGMPIPFADRPLPAAFTGETTTKQQTLNDHGLLYPLPFDLYNHLPAEDLRVVLDFSVADRLDAVTWEEEMRLPPIATLHPKGGGNLAIERHARDLFFGVHPERWDVEGVKELLGEAKARGARVAVLPELSLPSPGALGEVLAADPESYPEIVVAGSAHIETPETKGQMSIRANESRDYLDGICVAVVHKYKRFRFKKFGDSTYKRLQWEDLTEEQKTITILSGRRTRLGVVICADLQEKTIPRLLEDAGVNLLAAPSMTPKIGAFTPSLSGIAGYCQGVAVVANTRWDDTGQPFLCMCAVPRPRPSDQLDDQSGDGHLPAPELAIIDPNEKLPEAIEWIRSARQQT